MLTRRHLLKTLVISAGAMSAGSLLTACGVNSDSPLRQTASGEFPQSLASGDPRPDSVVLWTRALDPSQSGSDAVVRLEMATDASFANLVVNQLVVAEAAHDHCIKIRVVGLSPRTTYFYRFSFANVSSNAGRTRTAPAPDADVPVKFAWLSCQDYIGRYYNAYLAAVDEDLDFVCFIGDYIYETSGDPRYQQVGADRSIQFSHPEETLRYKLADSDVIIEAANSVGNYRDLYKTYRSDPLLQKMHERFAFVVMWDDHDFSDDCWQDVTTYYDGAANEKSTGRRRNAEQAFFEYMPIDQDSVAGAVSQQTGSVDVQAKHLYPLTRIYRDLHFGKNLHLFLTDYRTYRPDHLIPEDAFPGVIVIDQPSLTVFLAARGVSFDTVASDYTPYADFNDASLAARRDALRTALDAEYRSELTKRGLDPALMQDQLTRWLDAATTGNIAASVVNQYIDAGLKFSQQEMDAMPRGLGFITLFKTTLFSNIGARYFVDARMFHIYADYIAGQKGGDDSVLGADQEAWLEAGLSTSGATFKVVVSPVSMAEMRLDFSAPPLPFISALYGFVPAAYRKDFMMYADQWDGFPRQKKALLQGILGQAGAITISGDVHATFVSEHAVTSTGKRVIDFTGPAISSGTNMDFGYMAAAIINPAMKIVVPQFDNAMQQATDPTYRTGSIGQIRYSDSDSHGVSIMTVDADAARVEYRLMPSTQRNQSLDVTKRFYETSYYDSPSDYLSLMKTVRFRVDADGTFSQV